MSIVDVETVEIEDSEHFTFNASSDSLDTEDSKDLTDVVGYGSNGVNVSLGENAHECRSVGFKQPLGDGFELSGVRDDNSLLIFGVGQMHVDFADGFEALQSHVRKHVGLNAAQEHVILHLVSLFLFAVIFAFTI